MIVSSLLFQVAAAFIGAITTNLRNAWVAPHPFGSFAPVRRNMGVTARWLVDGFNTFSAMADAMTSASREIMIAGWWFTPDLVMKRQTGDDDRCVLAGTSFATLHC